MSTDARHVTDAIDPAAATGAVALATPWGVCEVLLVADRSRGSTHASFGAWRMEAVMCSGRPEAGTVLVAVPLPAAGLAASGWRYEFRIEAEQPGPGAGGRPAFSWKAINAPATPDLLVTASDQVRSWLVAHGWEQDPLNPARYHA